MGKSLEGRFFSKVDKTVSCWIWTGCKDGSGYGMFVVSGKTLRAHRYMWEVVNGAIPVGYQILHKCDNPPCVNPEHLFVGTNGDNVADKVSKGRQAFGPRKLSNQQIRDSILRVATGQSIRSISKELCVEYSSLRYHIRQHLRHGRCYV